MANNRMYLVNKRTGTRIYIAKYYPSTGWYAPETISTSLANGFHEADFGYLSEELLSQKAAQVGFGPPYSSGGSYGDDWVLEYETTSSESPSQPEQSSQLPDHQNKNKEQC